MYKDKRGLYPEEYKGLGKCHLRALHNVHEAAAREALKDKILHTAADEVRVVAKIHGKGHGKHYDDIVMMEVNDYDWALAVLELLETMPLAQYEAVFIGGGGAKKQGGRHTGNVAAALAASPQMTDFLLDHCTCNAMYAPKVKQHLLMNSSQVKQQGSQSLICNKIRDMASKLKNQSE